MRSIQENSLTEPGYVKALPLCYTLPGKSAAIISRIKFSDFDFKNIDLEADRYIIDVIDGTFQDKYLAFPTGTASRSIDDPLPPAAPDTPTPAQSNPFSMDSLVTTNDSLSITYDQGY